MVETVQEGVDQILSLEEIVPLSVFKICRQDCRFLPVALTRQLEEGVHLLGLERKVSNLISHQEVASVPDDMVQEVIAQVGLREVVEALPQQYETIIWVEAYTVMRSPSGTATTPWGST